MRKYHIDVRKAWMWLYWGEGGRGTCLFFTLHWMLLVFNFLLEVKANHFYFRKCRVRTNLHSR